MLITGGVKVGRRTTSLRMSGKFWDAWAKVQEVERVPASVLMDMIERNRLRLPKEQRSNRTEAVRDFLLHYMSEAGNDELQRRMRSPEVAPAADMSNAA